MEAAARGDDGGQGPYASAVRIPWAAGPSARGAARGRAAGGGVTRSTPDGSLPDAARVANPAFGVSAADKLLALCVNLVHFPLGRAIYGYAL